MNCGKLNEEEIVNSAIEKLNETPFDKLQYESDIDMETIPLDIQSKINDFNNRYAGLTFAQLTDNREIVTEYGEIMEELFKAMFSRGIAEMLSKCVQ